MNAPSYHHHLQTTPVPPQFHGSESHKFSKPKRALGDPVAHAKPYPRFFAPPPTNLENLTLRLETILPAEAKAAEQAKRLVFHALGDTGSIHGDNVQTAISNAMESQVDKAKGDDCPLFFYHLGDVVYFNGQSNLYQSQFYEPYQNYRNPIFAIPGNHDGDNKPRPNDPPDAESSLYGFVTNFCATASHHESAYRATMTQPYVYWVLDAPLLTIVGLYSNVDGTLDARGTSEQRQWLEHQLAAAPKDKALIIAVHHPPYSLDTSHGGYPDIEAALDGAIANTSRLPDAVLSGHVHSYQRFERTLGDKKIPYITAGAGGYANTLQLLHQIEKTKSGEPLPDGFVTTHQDLKLMHHNDQASGFLTIDVDGKKRQLTLSYHTVGFDNVVDAVAPDSVTTPW